VVRRSKKLESLKTNPKDVSFEELVSALRSYGFEVENYSGGSHYTVSHPIHQVMDSREPNSIPKRKPHILPVYVRRAIRWIESVEAIEGKEYHEGH
jgi:hypothetical protein